MHIKITDPEWELLIKEHYSLYHDNSKTWEWPHDSSNLKYNSI